MNFLNPWFALALAGLVVPALLILYFLKLRRKELLVPSTLLWRRAVQDLQVNAPFQRLRRNLLLLLQLLVLTAALLALARPIVKSEIPTSSRVVLLIDRSASMNALEDGRTRLELAKEQAGRFLRTLNQRTSSWRSFLTFGAARADTQVMVIAFSDRAQVISPFTTNTAELAGRIADIEPSDAPTDLAEALTLAEAFLAPPTRLTPGMEDAPAAGLPIPADDPATLVLFSDGRIPRLADLPARAAALQLVRVGSATDNVGIIALRSQRNYERPEQLNVFLTVRNFGPETVTTDVSILIDGLLQSARAVTLGPAAYNQPDGTPRESGDGATRSLTFDLVLDRGAVLEARLSRADALAADNVAYVAVPPPRRQSILVVTDGKYPFLDWIIKGLPLQEYPFYTPERYEAFRADHEVDGVSRYDVVIFDRYAPEQLPLGNYMFLGILPKFAELTATGTSGPQPLIWWDETHPILRYVSLDFLTVDEAILTELPAGAQVLIEGRSGPVLFRYAREGHQMLVLTFPVERSRWWRTLAFGTFMYNAIRYLGGGEADATGPVRPGDTLRIPMPPDATTVQLVRPDGGRVTLRENTFGAAYFNGTDRVGLYRVEGGLPGRDAFAVNLEDEWESDIRPLATGDVSAAVPIQQIAGIEAATPEVWRWFVGLALVLLLIEWWIYNRRVMI